MRGRLREVKLLNLNMTGDDCLKICVFVLSPDIQFISTSHKDEFLWGIITVSS